MQLASNINSQQCLRLLLVILVGINGVHSAASAWLPKRAQDCVPPASDAPYGLSLPEYQKVYDATKAVHSKLHRAGCLPEVLSRLSSCDRQVQHTMFTAVKTSSRSCMDAVVNALNLIETTMISQGCIHKESIQAAKSSEDKIRLLLVAERTSTPGSTCSNMMKTSRRAFADAFEGLPSALSATQEASTGSATIEPELPEVPVKKGGPSLFAALLAGAIAGLLVDMSLFPLDTIKTRLQSSAGFRAAGGFSGLYQGVGSIALGSAPSSALFFVAYEFASNQLSSGTDNLLNHLIVTIFGEVASSLVRVPADVVKSRQQVDNADRTGQTASLWYAIKQVYEEGSRTKGTSRLGAYNAFYTGWLSTIAREIPFGCIQFPLFQFLKNYATGGTGAQLDMTRTAICGMLAGSAAGSLTTPLDVVKTRIMLAERGETGIIHILVTILKEEGIDGLFKGVLPRTLWISLGGAIFLGGYDGIARVIDSW